MARREYDGDPNAPTPNSVVVAASAFVQDDCGRVLMVRRSDNGMWSLPGGALEVGETVAETAERETLEETGYQVEVTGIVGVYSNPAHVIEYDDGEVRQEFNLCFRARVRGGDGRSSTETPDVAWVELGELDSLEVQPSIRLRLRHGVPGVDGPHIG